MAQRYYLIKKKVRRVEFAKCQLVTVKTGDRAPIVVLNQTDAMAARLFITIGCRPVKVELGYVMQQSGVALRAANGKRVLVGWSLGSLWVAWGSHDFIHLRRLDHFRRGTLE